MIKNIIFDIGNVLVSFRWRNLIKDLGFSPETTEILGKNMLMDPLWQEMDRGIMEEEEIIEEFKRKCPGYEREIELFHENRQQVIEEFSYTYEWIKGLKERGFKVYYLSNYPRSFFKSHVEKGFTFIPLMDGGVVSAFVKMVKPDHEIYQHLMDKYALKAEECIFIDDTSKNIIAARELGMKGIIFKDLDNTQKELEDIIKKEGIINEGI